MTGALRERHTHIPDYRVKPGHELVYTPGIRSLDTFPMELRAQCGFRAAERRSPVCGSTREESICGAAPGPWVRGDGVV